MQDFDLSLLPSTFYRVTAKALVFDEEKRLLVVRNHKGNYELPGGGMEHGESFSDCLKREVAEELHAEIAHIGTISLVYQHRSTHKHIPVVRIAANVTFASYDLQPDDTIVGYEFVTKDEFLGLDMRSEGNVQEFADTIWRKN